MGLRHIHIKYKIGVRGFPARGYFIPGRDGAGARWLGIVPCRCRATGRAGVMGVGMRGGDASDYKSSIGLCKSRHEPIGVRGFLGVLVCFLKM